ncbi:MAG: peptide deformylase [Clostridiales bacterium]|nr:MAG: peptide deformylase [Clostridiales bacterium]
MALRNIRILDVDDCLRKRSREVTKFDDKLKVLIEDMKETMYKENGVGLAAVQIGVLRRIFVIDIFDGDGMRVFINPEIVKMEGEQVGIEGCLSIPEQAGIVARPKTVVVKYLDENYEEQELVAHDFMARAVCHEYDHINGRLYKDIALKMNPTEEEFDKFMSNYEKNLKKKENRNIS